MQHQVEDRYLEAAIQTATPQKLRLMLIEGAIRFATFARDEWAEPLPYAVLENTRRCQKILAELYAVVRKDANEAARRTADLYMYLYRESLAVLVDGDRNKLDDILSVLEVERETWQQVCDAMPEPPVDEAARSSAPAEITASDPAPVDQATYGAPVSPPATASSDGLSLEA